MARDYFGKELRVGDTVVYICEIQTSANFEEGTIEKVTEKQVKINGTRLGVTAQNYMPVILETLYCHVMKFFYVLRT